MPKACRDRLDEVAARRSGLPARLPPENSQRGELRPARERLNRRTGRLPQPVGHLEVSLRGLLGEGASISASTVTRPKDRWTAEPAGVRARLLT